MFNTLRANKDFPLKPQNKDIIFVYQKKQWTQLLVLKQISMYLYLSWIIKELYVNHHFSWKKIYFY